MVTKKIIAPFKRVFLVVLDGVGSGELPDAAQFGDKNSHTLRNLVNACAAKGRKLNVPNLVSLGLGSLNTMEGLFESEKLIGAFGRAGELSAGKDTTSGHWEMLGMVVKTAFKTFPNGFPNEILSRWVNENRLPGYLGNTAASGTEIIERLGAEHIKTGKPIVYTSADSVWQVAAHEEKFGLEKLYRICESARRICDDLDVARVIARPFIGDPSKGIPFQRTYNRHDYSLAPPSQSYLDVLQRHEVRTQGIGKIADIFANTGIDQNTSTKGNADGISCLLENIASDQQNKQPVLYFCNLIDFDMLYGHRRDVEGFAKSLEYLDSRLGTMLQTLRPEDLLLFSADHGNDPTFRGTDHTREYVPILATSQHIAARGGIDLGDRNSFADIGATIVDGLLGKLAPRTELAGRSFLSQLVS